MTGAAVPGSVDLRPTRQLGGIAPRRVQGEWTERRHGRTERPARAATIDWSLSADEIVRLVRSLDHGGAANPLGLPKFALDGVLHLVREARIDRTVSGVGPGRIVGAEGDCLAVASGTVGVVIERITTLDGRPADLSAMAGRCMDAMTDEQARLVSELDAAVAGHERWWRRRLAARIPYLLPQIDRTVRGASGVFRSVDQALPSADGAEPVLAALAAYLGRMAGNMMFDVGFVDPVFAACFEGAEAWFARQVPLAVRLDAEGGFDALSDALAEQVCQLHRHIGHAADLMARCPELTKQGAVLPVAIVLVDRLAEAEALPGSELTIAVRGNGGATRWIYDEALLDRAAVRVLQSGFEALLTAALAAPELPLGKLPMMTDPIAPWRDDACAPRFFADSPSLSASTVNW